MSIISPVDFLHAGNEKDGDTGSALEAGSAAGSSPLERGAPIGTPGGPITRGPTQEVCSGILRTLCPVII